MIKDVDFPNLLFFEILKSNRDISHFSTTRNGGVSKGEFDSLNLGNYSDDNSLNIYENRSIVARQFGIDTDKLITPHQTHSNKVIHINDSFMNLPKSEQIDRLYGSDASITQERGIFLCVTTADCVPILLFDTLNKATAAIHAGWKGTANHIIANTINEMTKFFGTSPKNVIAGIGPSISVENYEIGNDVEESFSENNILLDSSNSFRNKLSGKLHIDLKAINEQELIKLGVEKQNIETSHLCTFSNGDLFFSARRQSIHSGRMLTGIMINY